MMESKAWYTSKTMWMNLVIALVGAAEAFFTDLTGAGQQGGVIAMLFGAANMFLRSITTTGVNGGGGGVAAAVLAGALLFAPQPAMAADAPTVGINKSGVGIYFLTWDWGWPQQVIGINVIEVVKVRAAVGPRTTIGIDLWPIRAICKIPKVQGRLCP